MTSTGMLLARVLLGFALSFVIGFERALRGAPAGDRTFALVGTAATAITAVTIGASPQTIAGVVTGAGFIGAGVVLHDGGSVHGLTTAATILATVALGVVIGTGHLLFGAAVGALVLLTVEVRYVPFLSWADARRYRDRFPQDSPGG